MGDRDLRKYSTHIQAIPVLLATFIEVDTGAASQFVTTFYVEGPIPRDPANILKETSPSQNSR